jgi:predicted TIM-barrel fold metal-dependent hydrolase
LSPFLDPQWQDFIRWTGFKTPGGVSFNYPSWSPLFASPDAGLEDLQERVLSSADLALVTSYFGVDGIGNPYLAGALASGVNRWLAAEWLDRDDRLRGSISVTPQHAPQAVEEIDRAAADQRFLSVLLPTRSGEPYGNQRYWPILEAAAAHDLTLVLAYGGIPPVRWTPSFFEDYTLVTAAFQTQITSLIMCGVFDRWPNLRVTVSESGWTWLPALLWRMDQEWKAYDTEVPWLREPPSDYLREHFRFTTAPTDLPADAADLGRVIDMIGSDDVPGHELLLYSSDYPHVHAGGDALLDALDEEQRSRVLGGNALDWYRRLEAR